MTQETALAAVRRHYPDARTTHDTVTRLFELLKEHIGLSPDKIMHADSICSDDVNAIEYPEVAFQMLGPFRMGGLNGFPFTGLTGMNAFAHHVPEDGAVLVYFAPHIGITADGTPGQIRRVGQSKPSACCGAAQAALNKLLAGEIEPGHITELDYQQNQLEQILLRQADRIKAAPIPILEATEVFYEAIEERIITLSRQTHYPCRYLIVAGGIFINGDDGMGSFNSTRRFRIIDLHHPLKDYRDLTEQYWA